LRIEDLPGLRRRLAKLGARVVRPRLHERNALFRYDSGFVGAPRAVAAHSNGAAGGPSRETGPANGGHVQTPIVNPNSGKNRAHHKVREEIELEVSDAKALATIFEGLGMSRWFQYEKFRTTFGLRASNAWAAGLLIELDETPIGVFLELEGPANAIDRAAKASDLKSASTFWRITWFFIASIVGAGATGRGTCSSQRVIRARVLSGRKNVNFFVKTHFFS